MLLGFWGISAQDHVVFLSEHQIRFSPLVGTVDVPVLIAVNWFKSDSPIATADQVNLSLAGVRNRHVHSSGGSSFSRAVPAGDLVNSVWAFRILDAYPADRRRLIVGLVYL